MNESAPGLSSPSPTDNQMKDHCPYSYLAGIRAGRRTIVWSPGHRSILGVQY